MTTETLPVPDTGDSDLDDEVHAVCVVCNPALEDPVVSLCGELMTRDLRGLAGPDMIDCIPCIERSDDHDAIHGGAW